MSIEAKPYRVRSNWIQGNFGARCALCNVLIHSDHTFTLNVRKRAVFMLCLERYINTKTEGYLRISAKVFRVGINFEKTLAVAQHDLYWDGVKSIPIHTQTCQPNNILLQLQSKLFTRREIINSMAKLIIFWLLLANTFWPFARANRMRPRVQWLLNI